MNKARDTLETLGAQDTQTTAKYSEALKSHANKAALKDSRVFKGFNCGKSLQRQPDQTAKESKWTQKIPQILKDMYQNNLKDSEWILKIPKDSKMIQKIPKESKRIQMIPNDSKRFPKILKDYKKF